MCRCRGGGSPSLHGTCSPRITMGCRICDFETDCAKIMKGLLAKEDRLELSFIFAEAREYTQLLGS
jgi:hypothetical protein